MLPLTLWWRIILSFPILQGFEFFQIPFIHASKFSNFLPETLPLQYLPSQETLLPFSPLDSSPRSYWEIQLKKSFPNPEILSTKLAEKEDARSHYWTRVRAECDAHHRQTAKRLWRQKYHPFYSQEGITHHLHVLKIHNHCSQIRDLTASFVTRNSS